MAVQAESNLIYVVSRLVDWQSIEVMGLNLSSPDGSIGFLEVFTDKDKAEEIAAGKYKIYEIETRRPL